MLQVDQLGSLLATHDGELVAQADATLAAAKDAQARAADASTRIERATAQLGTLRRQAHDALAEATTTEAQLQAVIGQAHVAPATISAVLPLYLGAFSVQAPAVASALQQRYTAQAAQLAAQPVAPSTGHWSAAVGATVAARALHWLGTSYAWAGGSAIGPTAGVCAPGDAANDCLVTGFDCSGLALYAWAPYAGMDHLASAQYRSGSLHPSTQQLLPGDLVFWSSDGTEAGIHHVAIYVGDGNVVQAPESGDVVRVTPLASVDAGYFGATRPLT